MKKKKLNSKNPKYYPISKEDKVEVRKEVIATINKGQQKIITAYSVFCI